MQHGTSYSSTHSFETLHFLFESRMLLSPTKTILPIQAKRTLLLQILQTSIKGITL